MMQQLSQPQPPVLPPRAVSQQDVQRMLSFYKNIYPVNSSTWVACNASAAEAALQHPDNATALSLAFLASCNLNKQKFTSYDFIGFLSMTWNRPEPQACSQLMRFGPDVGVEGGKTLCLDSQGLRRGSRCFVMSVGLNGDTRFEEALHAFAPACRIIGMDGTLNSAKLNRSLSLPWLHLVPENFRAATGSSQYAGMRAELLKIDCEGCEYSALPPWLDAVCTEQVSVEVHKNFLQRPLQRVMNHHKLFARLDRTHRLAFIEPNFRWPKIGAEYTWVRRKPCPEVVGAEKVRQY